LIDDETDAGVDIDAEDEGWDGGLVLDTPEPPTTLPYADFEDYRARELLVANGIQLSVAGAIGALRHSSSVLRAAAAHVLGSLGDRTAIPALQRVAIEDSDLVQVEAAFALVRLGVEEARSSLHGALARPVIAYLSPSLAAGMLARLGDPAGYAAIDAALSVENLIARVVACKQLLFFVPLDGRQAADGRIVDAFALFARALADPHEDVQLLALRQLRDVDSPRVGELVDGYLSQPRSAYALAAAVEARRG
jgi:HEAT repeat protein